LNTIINFCKNNNFNYKLLPNGILIEKKFILLNKDYNSFNSNLPVYSINYNEHKRWLSIISKELQLNLAKKILHLIRNFKPYYEYSDFELYKSWNGIKNDSILGGYKIIKHFHTSLQHSNYYKKMSPFNFFNNKKNILKVIINRLIYCPKRLNSNYLLEGANISKLNPRVSIFSPSLAKQILCTYASNANIVLDPFSGFSGRMLGSLACNKEYIGSDIRLDAINESKQILKCLNLTANLQVKDFKEAKDIKANVLLTCPPYGDKENWLGVNDYFNEDYYIDYIINNFKCDKYIFVVKDTKYTKNIVASLKNGSWIKSLKDEKILIF
jgi:hypothetical protein